MKRVLVLSCTLSAALLAGGYAIPENSINATALSAAYIAAAHGADSAYYNPAAMVYNDDIRELEIDATYIGLSGINYQGTYVPTGAINYNTSSESESFLVPTLHYASNKLGDSGARFGLSMVTPVGLSKRWMGAPGVYSAEEFTLKTVELNPSIAIPLNKAVSLGIGFRVVKSEGIVKSKATVSRDMEGSATNYGYNLALMVKPNAAFNLAATYRSRVNLTEEGSAKLYSGAVLAYNGDTSVTVPLPAALNLAAAYTFDSGTTLEAVYGKTYWSAYQNLDFNYPVSIGGLAPYFDASKDKNWKDTNTYRIGITQKYDHWTAMAGLAYDETPIPAKTLGFELPDSNAVIASIGGRYYINQSWNVGLAGLIDMKKSRHISGNDNGISGEFTNARAYLMTAGIGYRF
ncbi:MAG: outer membrane protein transport protein [Sulfuricurvum sp.]|nr:outer membrane protein transport protein [Sulfuricurvum sp.]